MENVFVDTDIVSGLIGTARALLQKRGDPIFEGGLKGNKASRFLIKFYNHPLYIKGVSKNPFYYFSLSDFFLTIIKQPQSRFFDFAFHPRWDED